ncbi:MAG TPA: DDE-type integrase/transposase/recombinase [Streptosporangiaceae bacterium]|nr:DDE-type integrase/transposase/recombinase [Streptosporangiaceae bacterium]
MTAADREAAARRQRAQTIALWRWALTEPAMDPALTARQRGQVVRQLAAREHEGPSGRPVSVSRRTIDRWIVARRGGGFDALVPEPRQCAPRTDADVVELAVGLKMENPARTAAQVRRILAARLGWAPSERAIQRWFAARELFTRPDGQAPQAFGRFQADTVNEIWTADLMNGPPVAGRACHLAAIIDDNSRFLPGCQFIRRPDAVRFAGVLRGAIARHGIPRVLYTDNGSCFADESLARTCAVLGIKLTHSQPGRPMGRGKIERVFETIQRQFLVEVTGSDAHPARHPVAGLEELNDLLDRWVRTVYHARVHSETGQAPQARYAAAGPPARPEPVLLREAFRWSAVRLVRKTATVALEGNVYSVDPFLAGRKVELVFDPFDLTDITVYWGGRKVGKAVPQVIGRHAHPKAPPDEDPAPAALTGIDYLQLITDADQAALGERLNLAALDGGDPRPGGRDDGQDEHDGQEGR